MNKKVLRLFSVILLMSVLLSSIAFAQSGDSQAYITGDYSFVASESSATIRDNSFEYSDSCFARSSFLGCKHLEVLSIQACAASLSYYGTKNAEFEIDSSNNSKNIVDLLNSLEFEDVSTNTYYNAEKRENSVGVAVGHKTIIQEENEYTLLAIIPRSAGYKQEWAGNFTVGSGDIHEGFKAARDEILRYVKQYINENSIEGNLKVWIAGYSRGAAISNMVAGFFAGGGIEYFGDVVSITPEDIYCYTIGTPKTIKDGLDKNVELSVSASRDESEYVDDTPGDSYSYTNGGNVDVNDEAYNGIRNLINPRDSFPLLPPEDYGFTYYGSVIDPNQNIDSQEDMLSELKSVNPYLYNAFVEDNDIKPFIIKDIDIKSLSVIDTDKEMSPSEFFKERINGMVKNAPTNVDYVLKYQEALKGLIGTYGMSATLIGNVSADGFETSDLIAPLLATYLDYASKCLIEEGRADNEDEALKIAVKDLLEYITKEEINLDSFTVDDFFALLTKYISINIDEEIGKKAISGLAGVIPEDYHNLIVALFGPCDVNFSYEEPCSIEEALKAYILACYYGPAPECSFYDTVVSLLQEGESIEDADTAFLTRTAFYQILAMLLPSYGYSNASELLYDSDTDQYSAQGLFIDLLDILKDILMTVKDDEGNVIYEYESVSEIADEKLTNLINSFSGDLLEKSEELYGSDYRKDLEKHISNVCNNITNAREALMALFLGCEDNFNLDEAVSNAATLIKNYMQIPIEHFHELYLSKARYASRYEEHLCLIEFELNGGKINKKDTYSYKTELNSSINQPTNPSRSGYKFDGWYSDDQLQNPFDFSTLAEGDITIYAKWKKKPAAAATSKDTSPKSSSTESTTEAKEEQPIWSNVDEWAEPEMEKANDNKLIPETFTSKDFTRQIDRSDFAAVAVKLYESLTGKKAEPIRDNPFEDTNDEYVLKAYNLGITQGVSETEFGKGTITREQMATMIARSLKKAGIDTSVDLNIISKFDDDNEISDWAKESVYYMSEKGSIKGVGNNKFNPLGNAKIEEAIAISLRCIEQLKL